jgi:hypothetical protein
LSITVTVSFPRPIVIEIGTVIEIMGGVYTAPDHILGYQIICGERGLYFQAEPEEFGEFVKFNSEVPYRLPLIGQVTACWQHEKHTNLTVFPTSQTLYDYNQMSGMWGRAAVPAYWKVIEQKHAWEKVVIPFTWSRFEEDKYRPELLDVPKLIDALYPVYSGQGGFDYQKCVASLWGAADKLRQVERHLERLKTIDKLRIHLYEASKSSARDFHLSETREEASLVVESAITSAFSSLDIFAHALNELYKLSFTKHTASFFNVVTVRAEKLDSPEAPSPCLERDYPNEPLTKLLLQHRTDWIQELSEWRHFVIHHGCLNNGEYVGGGVLVYLPKEEADSLTQQIHPISATELVGKWTTNLKSLLEEAFHLLTEKATHIDGNNPETVEAETTLDPIVRPSGTPPYSIVRSFLELWTRRTSDEPKRIEHMFSRLAPSWQREWTMRKFRNFVNAHSLSKFEMGDIVSTSTDIEHGRLDRMSATLDFGGQVMRWGFTVIPVKENQYRLLRLPMSTIPSFEARIQVLSYQSKQSGRDTGHRDLIFSGKVKNASDVVLESVEVHIFWTEISEATVNLGNLIPGEERDFECSWKGAFISPSREYPPISIERGRFKLRMIYRLDTEEGLYWSQDDGYA